MNDFFTKLAILIWLCLFAALANGQDTLFLQLVPSDASEIFIEKNISYQKTFVDSVSIQKELQKVLNQLHKASYLAASIDELNYRPKQVIARVHIGQSYQWAKLKNGNIDPSILEAIAWRPKDFVEKKINYLKVLELQEELLIYAENNGYPFAQVYLEDLQFDGNELEASIFLRKNKLITIEAINIIGDAKISEQFLLNYLDLEVGAHFDKSKIISLSKRLQELPYVQESQAPKVTFKADKAIINLVLKEKNASRFDLIFGVLPNSNPIIDRRLLVTGTGMIDLQNSFGQGERIYAEFQQLRPQTQEAELAVAYPYIFNLPFGADARFNLYKRDTSYLDLEYDIGINYFFKGANYLKAFWNTKTTNVLSVNEAQLIQTRQLPNRLDVQNTLFGLEYFRQNLDYQFNPRKGWTLFMRAGAGQKKIKENNTIVNLQDNDDPGFDFRQLYAAIANEGAQYRLEARVEGYLPIAQRSTIKIASHGGTILSEIAVFQNEQFRIGGNRLLRGFDEESVFSTLYAVLTAEYRWLLTRNSNLYLFTDMGYIENITQENRLFQQAIGFGTGISFDTNAGVFSLSAAVGRDLLNSADFFDFRSPKIHFGYVSLF